MDIVYIDNSFLFYKKDKLHTILYTHELVDLINKPEHFKSVKYENGFILFIPDNISIPLSKFLNYGDDSFKLFICKKIIRLQLQLIDYYKEKYEKKCDYSEQRIRV